MKTIESENIAIYKGIGAYLDYIRPYLISKGGYPAKSLMFEFKVRTLSNIDRNRREQWVENVLVKIDFKDISDNDPPLITITQEKPYEIPFHPNIRKVSEMLYGSRGEWLYPSEWWQQMDSMALLVKLYDGLRYEKSGVILDKPECIGNIEAQTWYTIRMNEGLFPTGAFVTDIKEPAIQNPSDIPLEITNETQSQKQTERSIDTNPPTQVSPIPTAPAPVNTDPPIPPPTSPAPTPPARRMVIQAQGKKKFEVKVRSAGYQPQDMPKQEFVVNPAMSARVKNAGLQNQYELYITTQVQQIILKHLHWGQLDVSQNKVEQGGILLGNVYRDPHTNSYYGLVEHAIPSGASSASSTHLSMGHEQWEQILAQIETQPSNQQIIGWYHTHPNQLDVYMSETDLITQRTHFQHDWHFAVVLNPHQQIWRVFHGKNGVECRGFFLKDDQTTNSTEDSKDSLNQPLNNSDGNEPENPENSGTFEMIEGISGGSTEISPDGDITPSLESQEERENPNKNEKAAEQ